MPKKKQKVYVAMSGGVDSSVAAALLKRAGLDVVGVYMKCWQDGEACTSQDDERSARLAAAHLGISFYAWNFLKEYKEKVVDYMLKGYARGVTPNPDIMCNKEIKFGLFFEKARKLGADKIATGHYARLRREIRNPKSEIRILEAVDKNKDQSYFLSFIRPEVLPYLLFPIGEYTKPQVRQLALRFGLPNAQRKDSQGICFVGKVDVSDFLKQYITPRKGEIVDMQGKVLGLHEGVMYYTIGQRSGLGLSGGPYYVVNKDIAANRLVVSRGENDLLQKSAVVQNVNWFGKETRFQEKVDVKIRYRTPSVSGTLSKIQDTPQQNSGQAKYKIQFSEPQRAITAGQFAVFYKEEELLGGGVIS